MLSRTEYLSVPAAWGQHAELCEALVFCCVPCSETNFLQQGSLFRWWWYAAHEADQVSIINRRLKQLYGTLKHPLLPSLTYGPGLQAALDHLNYCNNQPSPAGAHYHNARRRYRAHWRSYPENQLRVKQDTNEINSSLQVKQRASSRTALLLITNQKLSCKVLLANILLRPGISPESTRPAVRIRHNVHVFWCGRKLECSGETPMKPEKIVPAVLQRYEY